MLEKILKKHKRVFLISINNFVALIIDDDFRKFIDLAKFNKESLSIDSFLLLLFTSFLSISFTKKDVRYSLNVVNNIKLVSTHLIEQRLKAL